MFFSFLKSTISFDLGSSFHVPTQRTSRQYNGDPKFDLTQYQNRPRKHRLTGAVDDAADDAADNDMIGSSPAAMARLRERERCSSIIAAGRARGNLDLAKRIAFGTNMTRAEAIDVIEISSTSCGRLAPETAAIGVGLHPSIEHAIHMAKSRCLGDRNVENGREAALSRARRRGH